MTFKAADSNALCLSCHGPGKQVGPDYKTLDEHTHHAPLSTGSDCIECHMAKTGSNSVKAEARNHTFNFISPAETIKNEIPIAATFSCRQDARMGSAGLGEEVVSEVKVTDHFGPQLPRRHRCAWLTSQYTTTAAGVQGSGTSLNENVKGTFTTSAGVR